MNYSQIDLVETMVLAGMSECTGATTFSTDRSHKWGSCGFAMPGTEVIVMNTATRQSIGPGVTPNLDDASPFHNPT